jgi:uncharacterized protein (DUF924 family)
MTLLTFNSFYNRKIEYLNYNTTGIQMTIPTAMPDNTLEPLYELFCEWYDINTPRLMEFRTFSEEKFSNIWTNWWFAKKEKQVLMDAYLTKYKPLFSINNPDTLKPQGMDARSTIVWTVGWIILWDQVSRNIFRNSAAAYATDHKARKLVEELMPFWTTLPISIRVTIILVYIHSEDINDLEITNKLLDDIKEPMQNYPTVWTSLTGIAKNHYDRMTMFGRIPERNKFLNRVSTPEEINYINSIY